MGTSHIQWPREIKIELGRGGEGGRETKRGGSPQGEAERSWTVSGNRRKRRQWVCC